MFYDPVKDGGTSLILVAGGIGINPVYSVLQTALQQQSAPEVHLLYSSKTGTELAFLVRVTMHCHHLNLLVYSASMPCYLISCHEN